MFALAVLSTPGRAGPRPRPEGTRERAEAPVAALSRAVPPGLTVIVICSGNGPGTAVWVPTKTMFKSIQRAQRVCGFLLHIHIRSISSSSEAKRGETQHMGCSIGTTSEAGGQAGDGLFEEPFGDQRLGDAGGRRYLRDHLRVHSALFATCERHAAAAAREGERTPGSRRRRVEHLFGPARDVFAWRRW